MSFFSFVFGDFFEDIEFIWKGRVKRKYMEDLYVEVEEAVKCFYLAVGFFFFFV